MMEELKVVPRTAVIADDSRLMRKLLAELLAQERITVTGEACNADEAIELCGKVLPDIIVIDLSFPGPAPATTVAAIRKSSPETRIVAIEGRQIEDILDDIRGLRATDLTPRPGIN